MKKRQTHNDDDVVEYIPFTLPVHPNARSLSNLRVFQKETHALAVEKGWYDPPKTDLEALMLITSEVAEAAEHIRAGTEEYHVTDKGKPDGLAVELADIIIRVLDYAEYKGLDLVQAIENKHEYNKTRSYRHGKKL